MTKFTLLLFLSVFALNTPVIAHSIHFDLAKSAPVVWVKAYYSQTSPVAEREIQVYAPGEEQPFQTGQTDARGYFAFVPSVAGDWIFEIDDQHGHKKKFSISIDESFIKGGNEVEEPPEKKAKESHVTRAEEEKDKPHSLAAVPTIYKLIFGLSLIFGITGIYYGVRAKQSLKKT